jgi:predicted RNase H-like HicB family nuclease
MHMLSGLNVSVSADPTGGYFAVVPALPGCGSQGDSEKEALENLDDAIMTVLEVLRQDDPDRLQALCGATTHPTLNLEMSWLWTTPTVSILKNWGRRNPDWLSAA